MPESKFMCDPCKDTANNGNVSKPQRTDKNRKGQEVQKPFKSSKKPR